MIKSKPLAKVGDKELLRAARRRHLVVQPTLLNLVLSHNHNTLDLMTGIRCCDPKEVGGSENILSYRAMGSLFRQQATFHPENSWKWLDEAERWEHLARAEITSHFKECNVTGRSNPAGSGAPSDTGDTRWETIAAA